MGQLYYMNDTAMNAMMAQQLQMQQQLIELQQKLIETQEQLIKAQKRIDKMTPKMIKDKDIFWHLNPDGLTSVEAANSKDPTTLRRFRDWNVKFAEKHIKPYVNPKVFSECLNQMTRELPERIAKQQTLKELGLLDSGSPPRDETAKLVLVR